MEFLKGGLMKLVSNILRVALRTTTNITRSKLKKKLLRRPISKILLIDTEQLSKMQISSKVFFNDFVHRFEVVFPKFC